MPGIRDATLMVQRTRIMEWGVHILVYSLAVWVYAASFAEAPEGIWGSFVLILLVQAFLYPAMYLLNDYTDFDDDRIKKGFSRPRPPLTLPFFLFAVAITYALVSLDTVTIVLTLLVAATGAAYSLPPPRLKERGVIGVATASLVQRLPYFLMICFRHPIQLIPAVFVAVYLVATGGLFILYHQREDLETDRITGVRTWGVHVGRAFLSRSIRGASVTLLLILAILWLWAMSQGPSQEVSFRFAGWLTAAILLTLGLFRLRYGPPLRSGAVSKAQDFDGHSRR